MILMAVSNNHCLNLVLPLMQEARVWKNLLHTKVLEIREHQTGINDDVTVVTAH